MKKLVSVFIVFLLLSLNCGMVSNAVTAPGLYGDIDLDGAVTVRDVTRIQQYLASLYQFDHNTAVSADFDHDGTVTVVDAAFIQRQLASIEIPSSCGGVYFTDITIRRFSFSVPSGKAEENTPVTFAVTASGSQQNSFTYEFLINHTIVRERSEENSFEYTFNHSGIYRVTVKVYNIYDICQEYEKEYRVIPDIQESAALLG